MADWAGIGTVREDGSYKCKVCENIFQFKKNEPYPICSNCGNYSWAKI